MNRLQHETSPYLRQHKDNPVVWYPWGDDAFAAARENDKPVLLSVGYSACHWCHVMAHESFEDEVTAAYMNEHFINVKVDREERPDVDDIYMQAVQALNRGQGGWPMTVFLLPDGRPFYGGTYYPKEPRFGMPSFRQVLEAMHNAYHNRREDVEEQATNISRSLQRENLNIPKPENEPDERLLDAARKGLLDQYDARHGGFGAAPKFPQPMLIEFLLREGQRADDAGARQAAEKTLQRMARGGMYDQVGGGFHRYSVDAVWLVPHFEKMLYDNAQLSRLYLHAWQSLHDPFYREIAEEIYEYVLREMTAPEGGFYSATDADSEGEEGKFFVWTLDELRDALEPITDDVPGAYEVAVAYWAATPEGNFEGSNILYRPQEDEVVADTLDMSVDALREKVAAIKDRLYAARTSRVHPGLDDKVLTAWNGMMLASLAEAARVFDNESYRVAAERAGEFLLSTMRTDTGRLLRTYNQGQARLNAYLEDYANLIDGLLELYQTTFLEKWFDAARELADVVLAHFAAADGGFFDTSDDHEKLITRPRALQDNAVPAGNTMMAKQLARLAAYTGDARYDEAARAALQPLYNAMQQFPIAFGEGLNALSMMIVGVNEVAIVGNPTAQQTRDLLAVVCMPYRPNTITALAREVVEGEANIPLLSYRTMRNGEPTVYVCRNFACRMPVTTAEALADLLNPSA